MKKLLTLLCFVVRIDAMAAGTPTNTLLISLDNSFSPGEVRAGTKEFEAARYIVDARTLRQSAFMSALPIYYNRPEGPPESIFDCHFKVRNTTLNTPLTFSDYGGIYISFAEPLQVEAGSTTTLSLFCTVGCFAEGHFSFGVKDFSRSYVSTIGTNSIAIPTIFSPTEGREIKIIPSSIPPPCLRVEKLSPTNGLSCVELLIRSEGPSFALLETSTDFYYWEYGLSLFLESGATNIMFEATANKTLFFRLRAF